MNSTAVLLKTVDILLSAFEKSLASTLWVVLKAVIPFCPSDRNFKQNKNDDMKCKRTGMFLLSTGSDMISLQLYYWHNIPGKSKRYRQFRIGNILNNHIHKGEVKIFQRL